MTRASPLRRPRRIIATAVFVGLVVAWAIFLRPQFLGGPAGYVMVAGTSMEPALHTGDLVVTQRRRSYRVGEVVAYRIPAGQAGAGRVVIHRIAGGSTAEGYVMRGDNRASNDLWRPRPSDVVGAQQLRVAALGNVTRMILSPVGLGLLAGLATMVILLPGPERRVRRDRGRLGRRELAGEERLTFQALPPALDDPPPVADDPPRVADDPPPSQLPGRVQAEPDRSFVTNFQRMMRDLAEAVTGTRPRRGREQHELRAAAGTARAERLAAPVVAALGELRAGLQHGVVRAREARRQVDRADVATRLQQQLAALEDVADRRQRGRRHVRG